MSLVIVFLVGSYLIGSVPFGLALGKIFCGVDLREHGSGNIGATNAWRVLGWKFGLPVFALDLAKGLVPVAIARMVQTRTVLTEWSTGSHGQPLHTYTISGSSAWLVVGCGLAAILGHSFSPFLKFKGGKGVATSMGVALGLSWKAALVGFALWGVMLVLTGFISVASLVGTPVGAYLIWFLNGQALPYAIFALLATAFVVVKHISNMRRLVIGKEPSLDWALLPRLRKK